MFPYFKFSIGLIVSLMVISGQTLADSVSLEGNFVAGETTVTDHLNRDRIALTNGVNNIRAVFAGSVQSSGQIKADTIGEENMADDANPRIRTNEGATCADVVSGLIPGTSSSLVGTMTTGYAYPDGYRVAKTATTAHTFTASKWTDVYILSNGSFDYQEYTIGATAPTAPSNSAPIARVSTDTTTINTVTDQRITSCLSGPFSILGNATGEASLADIFQNGSPIRKSYLEEAVPVGYAQGAYVSYDTATAFIVLPGSLYINGKYRTVSQNVAVPSTTDDPLAGTSGIVAGSLAASTKYNVYAVADQALVKTFSVSFGTAPTGLTNYRKIGSIKTNASTVFTTSSDTTTIHSVNQQELIRGWVKYDMVANTVFDSFNVASVADGGTGIFTITWDVNFLNAHYAVAGTTPRQAGTEPTDLNFDKDTSPTSAAVVLNCLIAGGTLTDQTPVTVMAVGR